VSGRESVYLIDLSGCAPDRTMTLVEVFGHAEATSKRDVVASASEVGMATSPGSTKHYNQLEPTADV
jgi:hypothetical protein